MHTRKIIESQHRAQHDNVLNIWTVYDHPKDFPHSFVARRFEVRGPFPVVTDDIVQGELEIIRESFRQAGLVKLMRNDDDDPKIVESWI